MLPTLPTPPSRDDPVNFAPRADAFLAALPAWTDAANALEQSLQLVATTGTSTTSLTIGAGSKTLTTQSGKAWAPGAFVYVVSAASVGNLMIGQVTSYNSTTGALTFNVTGSSGSGTIANWVIGLSGGIASAMTFVTSVTTAALYIDASFYSTISSSKPIIAFDTTDYLAYDRSNDRLDLYIGGTSRQYWSGTDGPARPNDATTNDGLVRKSQMDAADAKLALGGFRALVVSATGTSSSISVSADALLLLDGSGGAVLATPSLTINSAASGVNGLDTGSLAANTWYSVWVIHDGTNTAGLLSLSASAPTMPGGYTYKARVGWIRTDSSGAKYPLAFTQAGRVVRYRVAAGSNVASLPVMASGSVGTYSATTPTYSAVGVGSFAPPTAASINVGLISAFNGASQSNAMCAPNASYGGMSSTKPPPLSNIVPASPGGAFGVFGSLLLESTNIYVVIEVSGGALLACGWEDNL